MSSIKIQHNPDKKELEKEGIFDWPIWEKEASEFPWYYDEQEICYFLQGDVIVTTDDGQSVNIGKGNLVTFPKDMSCTWKILEDVKKHYKFG